MSGSEEVLGLQDLPRFCATVPVPPVLESIPDSLFFQKVVRIMILLISGLLSALACTAFYPAAGTVSARQIDRERIQALQRQAADRFSKSRLAASFIGGDVRLSAGVKNFTFSNPAASGELSISPSRERSF